MKLKEFLKPTIWKVIIFIILLILTSVFNYATYCPECTRAAYGFPLALYELPGCKPVSAEGCPGYRVIYSALIVDLIFWYLVSCLIVWFYDKRKKKS